jgi:cupin 2 domain-containing protein
MPQSGNLFSGLPEGRRSAETVEPLTESDGLRIERTVSTGQATPKGEWLDQGRSEWVALLSGGARLLIEGEAEERCLEAGDWLLLPAHCRHRVTWTSDREPTVWLAAHF